MTDRPDLESTARAMVAKGVLAVDETTPTCTKRFAEFGIESTAESRRDYRGMLFTTPGIGEYVSAAIMFDETIRQSASDGKPFVDLLNASGILPGIKVDTGPKAQANAAGETVTEGLDGLRERLLEYREIGARFTKWRAVLRIGQAMPSRANVEANADALARYAALVQEARLVPIVEPEVLMSGEHGIEDCQLATEEVLHLVFQQLYHQHVMFEGMVLKPNMVTPGSESPGQASAEEIAERTVETLRRCVPAAVPGIAFLSGGQTGEEACANLNAMARLGPHPWPLTYSFGRALQYPALPTWAGRTENVPAAQRVFAHRARMAALARTGEYSPETEQAAVSGT